MEEKSAGEYTRNRFDWEARYLHENYSQSLAEDAQILQPCPDVYWFPIFKQRFADEFVEEMEAYGKWSDGSNNVGCFFTILKLLCTFGYDKKVVTWAEFG